MDAARHIREGEAMRSGIIRAEAYKLLISSRCLFLIIILLAAKCVISNKALTPARSFEDDIYKEYMTELAGPVDEEKRSRVAEIRAGLNDTILRLDEMDLALEKGEITTEEYSKYLREYNAAKARSDIFVRVEEHLAYIDEMSAEGEEAYFVYDTGWRALFFTGFDYTLYAAILIAVSGAFAMEHNGKSSNGEFAQILRSTPNGRRRTFVSKFLVCAILSLTLTVIWNLTDAAVIARGYELPLAASPLISIESFSDMGGALSIWQYAAAAFAVRCASHVMLAAVICALSEILKKSISVLSVSVIVTLLPDMLARSGIGALSRIGFVGALRATPLFIFSASGEWGRGYAAAFLCAILLLAAVLTLCAERVWDK